MIDILLLTVLAAPAPLAAPVLAPPTPVVQRGGRGGRGGGGGRPSFGGGGGRPPGARGPAGGRSAPIGLPKAIKRSLPVALPKPSLTAPRDTASATQPLSTVFFPEADLPEQEALQVRYFQIADYDASGWISFREATAALGVDRGEFPSYDDDRDGRIVQDEFNQRFQDTIEMVGSFRPPVPAGASAPRAAASASAGNSLIATADLNGDGGLSLSELETLLNGLGMTGIPAGAVIAKFDQDQDDRLDMAELEEVAKQLSQGGLAAAPDPVAPPSNIDDLFGVPARRVEDTSGTPLPPRLVGPVTHFRRLDFDDDGVITPDDLLQLQAPIQVDVRARAIIAFLDANGDGRLDRDEFDAAMD